MNRQKRLRGFTLVELLVVISIIGMLMALLLPAVQSAREAGRANTCRNNMRNVGLSIVQYESAKQLYPGFNNIVGNSVGPGTIGSGGNGDRSFAFVILPYMDHRAMYDALIASQYAGDKEGILNYQVGTGDYIKQTIEVFVCPSSPPEGLNAAPTSYVVNSGQIDATTPANGKPFDYKGNGVFHTGIPTNNNPVTSTSAAFVSGGDGLGTTLMLSENCDAGTWTGLASPTTTNNSSERFLGFTYSENLTPNQPTTGVSATDPFGINGNFGLSRSAGTPNATAGWARPAAFHPGNVNVLFCDSHVRAISDSIDYKVYQALMTPSGKLAVKNDGTNLTSGHGAFLIPDEASIR